MKYLLRKLVLGKVPEIELTREQYDELKQAYNVSTGGLEIERIYDILIMNYLDFEKEFILIAADSSVYMQFDHQYMSYIRVKMNKSMINLLNTTRMYIDHIKHHISSFVINQYCSKKDVESLLATEYDNSFEFRFMEELRNHAQHRCMPVHMFQLNSYRDDMPKEGRLYFAATAYCEKDFLEKEGGFKKTLLESMPRSIDLKLAAKIYIESISKIHCAIRERINPAIDFAHKTISSNVEIYSRQVSNCGGLSALCMEGEGRESHIVERIPLGLEWFEIRSKLIKRNRQLTNLHHRHITSEVRKS